MLHEPGEGWTMALAAHRPQYAIGIIGAAYMRERAASHT